MAECCWQPPRRVYKRRQCADPGPHRRQCAPAHRGCCRYPRPRELLLAASLMTRHPPWAETLGLEAAKSAWPAWPIAEDGRASCSCKSSSSAKQQRQLPHTHMVHTNAVDTAERLQVLTSYAAERRVALLLVGGVDGKGHAGSREALNWLLAGLSGRDVFGASLLDQALDEVVLVVEPHGAKLYAPAELWERIQPLLSRCRRLQVRGQPENRRWPSSPPLSHRQPRAHRSGPRSRRSPTTRKRSRSTRSSRSSR